MLLLSVFVGEQHVIDHRPGVVSVSVTADAAQEGSLSTTEINDD
jgi:hypothetical protein